MNIDFYAIESIKQNQVREHLTAEKRARIHEAFLDAPRTPGVWTRMMSMVRRIRTDRMESVESQMTPVAVSTNASNGD